MSNIVHATVILVLLFIIAPQVLANPPPAYEGRRLFVSYCQLCHGADGKGNGPLAKTMKISPADLTTTIRSRSDTILTKIITGKDDKQLPVATVITYSVRPCQNGKMFLMRHKSRL